MIKDELKLIRRINEKKRFHQPVGNCGVREAGEAFFPKGLYFKLHCYVITGWVLWQYLSPWSTALHPTIDRE